MNGKVTSVPCFYYSHIDYDMNGNIKRLVRNTLYKNGSAEMDRMNYTYSKDYDAITSSIALVSNRLYHVRDEVAAGTQANDYDGDAVAIETTPYNTENQNYFIYDRLGNIIENKTDGYKIE